MRFRTLETVYNRLYHDSVMGYVLGNKYLFFVYDRLLSDAKVFEYISQYFVGGDFAGDFAEVVEAFADVLGDKFAANGRIESGNDTLNGREGMGESFVVAYVADDDVSGVKVV